MLRQSVNIWQQLNQLLFQIILKTNSLAMSKQSLLYLRENMIRERIKKTKKIKKIFRCILRKENRDHLLGKEILMLWATLILCRKSLTPNTEENRLWLRFICQWMLKLKKRWSNSKHVMKLNRHYFIKRNSSNWENMMKIVAINQ